ncbi:Lhr family ATP dependent helicase [Sediminihabitans luteus]|uniref:Lhr family ATP dependent helicase n=1 Tax=Sediminihabitans luteus TaxID=1138585 RepID=A0A2M9CCC9_9CELL|nr:ATP-dependent helicase [Sediminihabitans luteus]PJJ69037.1 Lhr family ATP dependent helicase [Sediminihabitans luteus]GII99423.1 DEAD/DEAH box helicase [Sediminihabitans luteus]
MSPDRDEPASHEAVPAGPDGVPAGLGGFAEPTRAWFASAFEAPTPAQSGTWDAVRSGRHALVVAPTGSGKTLAAFLSAIDDLTSTPTPEDPLARCRVLYVSPLKALAADVDRNLRAPLAGIRHAAQRLGATTPDVVVGTRTGDTPASERRQLGRRPPDVLITTPESLYLVLTSAARAGLAGVRTVIVDEIHAVAGTKRGAHLALSLERLDAMLPAPAQRVGLSATVRPVEDVARFLAGTRSPADGGREVVVVQPPATKRIEVEIAVPVPDLTDLASAPAPPTPDGGADDGRRAASVWPHVEERVVDLVEQHRSTLVFTNARRSAERLTARVNEVASARRGEPVDVGSVQAALVPGQSGVGAGVAPVLARAHHGSMSRAERTRTEDELKAGRLPAVVATSSLELGIDMGAIDLVVQVGAPPSVASAMQRIGRAGHQVGAVSHGVVLPTFRGELVPAAVVAERMRAGLIEHVRVLSNPLDVLAQQVVAMVALDDWSVADLAALVRRAAPYEHLGDATLHAVLDMLAGRYPGEDFAELRPRVVWDRAHDVLSARPGALRLAVTSGGTIPDRGQYGVFLAGAQDEPGADAAGDRVPGPRGGRRVGELDEEMVYESRVGDTFTLGSSTWRIEDITPDRVLVTPSPGAPGRLPFWKGDQPGRPAELGRAVGTWVRETSAADDPAEPGAVLRRLAAGGLDPWAAQNVAAYLREQRTATGRLPDDRTVVVERFRDELGDWRVVIHSPWGARVHAPWALVLAGRLRERFGFDAAAVHADDGIVLRLPDTAEDWESGGGTTTVTAADLLIDPDDVLDAVRAEIAGSALFAARFREAAARSLLLPRRRPDRRQPLWQQRHRSAQLLAVAAQHDDFPVVLEAVRECLQDDFDVDALRTLMTDLAAGRVRVVEVETPTPSPFARSLLFGYTAQFLYDGDSPLAERRAAALTLDPTLLAELLGTADGASQLADLLDPDVVERTEAEIALRAPGRRARDAEGMVDVLRRTGPLTLDEAAARTDPEHAPDVTAWLTAMVDARRVIEVRVAGRPAWAVVEDAGRLRDALGVALPAGLPAALTAPVDDPLGDLVRRHARTHGPFAATDLAARLGLGVHPVAEVLRRLERSRTVVHGRLRPEPLGGTGDEWCDAEVLRVLRRRSLAALRSEIEPVEQEALGVFAPRWHRLGTLRGTDGLLEAVEQLAGLALPASAIETLVLPARVSDYAPTMLDSLTTAGEVLWAGHGPLPGAGDGLVSLHLADGADLTLPAPAPIEEGGPLDSDLHRVVLDLLTGTGGYFLPRLASLAGSDAASTLDALWDLVWAGRVTNDGFGALRDRLGVRGGGHRAPRPGARPRPLARARFAHLGRPGRPDETLPAGGGRWSALPAVEPDPTRRTAALTRVLLDRHGLLTRGTAHAEGVPDYFRGVYRALGELEGTGTVRRGYFVEHLGASQFALPGAVDQLRSGAADRARSRDDSRQDGAAPRRRALLLAATDPANPYGAALPWPDRTRDGGHRPGRKAGAVVVLVDGALVLYLERGGRSLLTSGDAGELAAACAELAAAGRAGRLPSSVITRVDGLDTLAAAGRMPREGAVAALLDAGFTITPRGVRAPR